MSHGPDVPFIRTPDERFENLSDFAYEVHYLKHGNLRMAYVDEASTNADDYVKADVFLCLHGQPTWSYLYRKMIPLFLNYTTTTGTPPRRVIVPDLIGFGRSDKPTEDADYTFTFHRNALLHFVESLNLTNITLVVQDWGGLLGLTLPLAFPSRFKRLVVMNTSLAIGQTPTQGFVDWRAFSNKNPDMKIGQLMGRSCRHLSAQEAAAYDAPFPSREYKAGVRRFPQLVMTDPSMEGVEVSKQSMNLYRTSDLFEAEDNIFMACGQKDPVLGPPVMQGLAQMWKNGCYYAEIEEGGHFLQEWGDKVARLAIQVFEKKEPVEGVRKVSPVKASL